MKDNLTIEAISRMDQSPLISSEERSMSSFDSLIDPDEGLPGYMKASSSSERKKIRSHHLESSVDKNDKKSLGYKGLKSAKLFSRTSSIRSVRILVKKTSFKPRRASLNHPKVSEDAAFDKATYTSTLKDSKFQKAIEFRDRGTEMENNSGMKVCRYHHCSLHGHCHGEHDEPVPEPKRFLFNRRRSFNKKKSVKSKTESRKIERESSERNENLDKSSMNTGIELSGSDVDSSADIDARPDSRTPGCGYEDIQDLGLIEVAFGETSFPERAYQENLEIMTKYEKYFGGVTFGQMGYCLRCSRRIVDEDNNSIPEIEKADAFDTVSSTFLQDQSIELAGPYIDSNRTTSSEEDRATIQECPQSPLLSDEVAKKSGVLSLASDGQTASYSSSYEQGSVPGEDLQVFVDSEAKPSLDGRERKFSKPGHISMWNLIHHHMSSNLAAEPQHDVFEGADAKTLGTDALSPKQTRGSSKDLPDSDVGTSNDSEAQDIEVRKRMAINLVREAIEKILLPEVQDLISDNQSITNESTYESEQNEDLMQENDGGTDADKCGVGVQLNVTEQRPISDGTAGEVMKSSSGGVAIESEKKAPKRWSNLKKWILLQRFIRELEEVKKFNPKKPWFLPLYPEPEAGKVTLRHQTPDGRKNSEEWMLDYALRQAVSQLDPTQKRKVALLVKAFETVVPSQENPLVQFRIIPGVSDNENDDRKVEFFASEGDKGKTEVDGSIAGITSLSAGDGEVILDSKSQQTGSELANENAKPFVPDDNCGESLVESRSSTDGPKEENVEEVEYTPENGDLEETVAASDGMNASTESSSHIKMWHMIYQHVVTGIAERVGSELLEGSEDDEAEDGTLSSRKSSVSIDLRSGFTKSIAVELVKEAVDEILLPQVQDDSSDARSVIINAKEESKPGKPKNWIKLKKLMLLKKSIKALEEVRKHEREPHQVPQIPDAVPEKVDLRRQMMEERKKAEQWMLDYAVQHIVTKLTPARKRRVSMLVEAFEAVVPFPEI